MKLLLLAFALLAVMAGPAFSIPCEEEVKEIEATLSSAQIASDERDQIKDMAEQAAELCAGGNDHESLDVAAEAKAMPIID